jgi:hypothetical protein
LSCRRSRFAMRRIEDQRGLAATIIQVNIIAFLDMMN